MLKNSAQSLSTLDLSYAMGVVLRATDWESVQQLIELGASCIRKDLLNQAAEKSPETLKLILLKDKSLSEITLNNTLESAVQSKNWESAKLLIEAGAHIELDQNIVNNFDEMSRNDAFLMLSIFSKIYDNEILSTKFADTQNGKNYLNLCNKIEQELVKLAKYCNTHKNTLDQGRKINEVADKIIKAYAKLDNNMKIDKKTASNLLNNIIETQSKDILGEYNAQPSLFKKLKQAIGEKIKNLFFGPEIHNERGRLLQDNNSYRNNIKEVDTIINDLFRKEPRKEGDKFLPDEIRIIKEISNIDIDNEESMNEGKINITKIMGYSPDSFNFKETIQTCKTFMNQSAERKDFCEKNPKPLTRRIINDKLLQPISSSHVDKIGAPNNTPGKEGLPGPSR